MRDASEPDRVLEKPFQFRRYHARGHAAAGFARQEPDNVGKTKRL